MLGAAIAAAIAAFGLLVAGLVTGQVWLAIACVIASVIGLVLLLLDTRRAARADAIEDAPTTGAFLGEDVDAFVAQREARRDTGASAAAAGLRGAAGEEPGAAPIRRAATPAVAGWNSSGVGGFREAEPDFTGPLPVVPLATGASAPVPQPAPPAPASTRPAAPVQAPARPAPPATVAGAAFTMPTVSTEGAAAPRRPSAPVPPAAPPPSAPPTSAPPPSAPPTAARGPVGDLHDYVASTTGSAPRIESSGAVPSVVREPDAIRWESSIPPSAAHLVADQSREAIRHVNDLPVDPPTPRRARREEPRRTKPVDPLDPNWRPPLD